MAGFVYLVRNGDLHKIGRTDNLEKRLKQLKPDEVVQVLETSRSRDLEFEMHKRFKDKRLPQTEYFRLDANEVIAARMCLGWAPPERSPQSAVAAPPQGSVGAPLNKTAKHPEELETSKNIAGFSLVVAFAGWWLQTAGAVGVIDFGDGTGALTSVAAVLLFCLSGFGGIVLVLASAAALLAALTTLWIWLRWKVGEIFHSRTK